MTEKVECIVIGAGVVGLAVARACAKSGMETLLLEAAPTIGTGISSRNSEVIHAGIYYAPGSLKARLCVAGKKLLYTYCQEHGIAHENCGKLIVATNESQLNTLNHLVANAAKNNVTDLQLLNAEQSQKKEPELNCLAALYSPSTGIVDSHAFMLSLLGNFEAAGGILAVNSPVASGQALADGVLLNVGGASPMPIKARYVINCAGLGATELAHKIDGINNANIPSLRLAKGNYYSLSAKSVFSHLIYPVPVVGGLGVHLTLDLNGRARFGPDVQWLDELDFAVDLDRTSQFEAAIRCYWPSLPDNALHPDYAGVRPKIFTDSEVEADFLIQNKSAHGVSGLINLFGIESPGLTASLALAQEVLRFITRDNA